MLLKRLIVLAAVALPCMIPSQARAQMSDLTNLTPRRPRFDAGIGLEYAQPVGQFRQNVRQGFGGGGHFVFGLDPQGILGIRVDGGFVNYGNEDRYVPISGTIRLITLNETTSNNIFVGSIGPQLAVRSGPVRPYVNAGVGIAYFYTETSLKDYDGNELASNTNYSDNSLMYTLGGGVGIPLAVRGTALSLDLGARYEDIGRTRYLTRNDIQNDPNSDYGVLITPHQSEARYVAYHLGVNVRF